MHLGKSDVYLNQGDLILGENSQWFELYDVNCYIILYGITTMDAICHINGIIIKITQINDNLILMNLAKRSDDITSQAQ